MDPELDRQLATLMRRQHGAFARRQAVALGFADATISSRLARGRYRILQPGVACEHGTPDSWELRAMAAVLWAGGDAALSSVSAARAMGWSPPPSTDDGLHLLTRHRTLVPVPGVTLHRSRSFDPTGLRRVGGLPCTPPGRTLVDVAGLVERTELRGMVQQSVRRGQVDPSSLGRALLDAGRVAGVGMLRAVLAELSPLHAACRSFLESAFVDLTVGTGLEPTAMNHPVRDARGARRVIDAVYLPEGLPVELDGAATHSTGLDVADDAERERDIVATGDWLPFERFSHDEVVHRGEAVLRRLEAALRAAGSTRRRRA